MTGISTGEVTLLAARFPWKRFESFIDMGCAQGALPVRVALTHPHLRGAGLDLPDVEPVFIDYVKSFGLDDRLRFIRGDFFKTALPSADVISFGHVFHGQSREGRCELVAKARDALPNGGALIVYDAMTAPGRKQARYHSLLSSLNIMLETRSGYESHHGGLRGHVAYSWYVITYSQYVGNPDRRLPCPLPPPRSST